MWAVFLHPEQRQLVTKDYTGPVRLASSEDVSVLLREASRAGGDHKFSALFLRTEWDQVVDAWQLDTWEAYRDVQRLGRRTRLPEHRRAVLWGIFEQVRARLRSRGLMTESAVFQALAEAQSSRPPAFDAAVVDEAQDVSIAQLRFLAALGGSRPNALFFAGDLGQRIFQQPFSWRALGVDVRGRSRTLRVNYVTGSNHVRAERARVVQRLPEAQAGQSARTAEPEGGPPTRRTGRSPILPPAPPDNLGNSNGSSAWNRETLIRPLGFAGGGSIAANFRSFATAGGFASTGTRSIAGRLRQGYGAQGWARG